MPIGFFEQHFRSKVPMLFRVVSSGGTMSNRVKVDERSLASLAAAQAQEGNAVESPDQHRVPVTGPHKAAPRLRAARDQGKSVDGGTSMAAVRVV